MTCILSEPTTILTHPVVDEGQKIPESHTESSLHMKYIVGDIHLYTTYILQYLHITLYSDVSCDSCFFDVCILAWNFSLEKKHTAGIKYQSYHSMLERWRVGSSGILVLHVAGSTPLFKATCLVLPIGVGIYYVHCVLPTMCHRENGGTLGMVPLIINPIYTL